MHQLTIFLACVLVPLIVYFSYRIGIKKQKEELEKQKKQYLRERQQFYPQHVPSLNDIYQPNFTCGNQQPNNRLHTQSAQFPRYNIEDRAQQPYYQNTNKRLSFSEAYRKPQRQNNNEAINEYETRIIHEILGPSPQQTLTKPNRNDYYYAKENIPTSYGNLKYNNYVNNPEQYHQHRQIPYDGYCYSNNEYDIVKNSEDSLYRYPLSDREILQNRLIPSAAYNNRQRQDITYEQQFKQYPVYNTYNRHQSANQRTLYQETEINTPYFLQDKKPTFLR